MRMGRVECRLRKETAKSVLQLLYVRSTMTQPRHFFFFFFLFWPQGKQTITQRERNSQPEEM